MESGKGDRKKLSNDSLNVIEQIKKQNEELGREIINRLETSFSEIIKLQENLILIINQLNTHIEQGHSDSIIKNDLIAFLKEVGETIEQDKKKTDAHARRYIS